MNPYDPSAHAPGPPGAFHAVVVAVILLLPLGWVALSQAGHSGGGALDAVGELVLWALCPAAVLGAILGAVMSQSPKEGRWGIVLGLVSGAFAEIIATILIFAGLLGG